MKNQLPILYSFRRCPYAMRARLAIKASDSKVELREVVLSDKPEQMLRISPKGTVPVLQLTEGQVLEESRDIMMWALKQNDPQNWLALNSEQEHDINTLIDFNDNEFKQHLDHYKYAERFPENTQQEYREQGAVFLTMLEERLKSNSYLVRNSVSWADIAIFPFIRQFAFVDKVWFDDTDFTNLKKWLENFLSNPLFLSVMEKQPQWKEGDEITFF